MGIADYLNEDSAKKLYISKLSPVLTTINMLSGYGYNDIAVCVPNYEYMKDKLFPSLREVYKLDINATYFKTRKYLAWENSKVWFYCYEGNQDLPNLVGMTFSAVIVVGKCSDGFLSRVRLGLRLGDVPLTVQLSEG